MAEGEVAVKRPPAHFSRQRDEITGVQSHVNKGTAERKNLTAILSMEALLSS